MIEDIVNEHMDPADDNAHATNNDRINTEDDEDPASKGLGPADYYANNDSTDDFIDHDEDDLDACHWDLTKEKMWIVLYTNNAEDYKDSANKGENTHDEVVATANDNTADDFIYIDVDALDNSQKDLIIDSANN